MLGRSHLVFLSFGAALSLASFAACSAGTDKAGPAELGDGGGVTVDGAGIDFDGGISVDGEVPEGGGIVGDPQTCDEAAARQGLRRLRLLADGRRQQRVVDLRLRGRRRQRGRDRGRHHGHRQRRRPRARRSRAHGLTKIYLPWVAELKGPDTRQLRRRRRPLDGPRCARTRAPTTSSRRVRSPSTSSTRSSTKARAARGQGLVESCPGNQLCATARSRRRLLLLLQRRVAAAARRPR